MACKPTKAAGQNAKDSREEVPTHATRVYRTLIPAKRICQSIDTLRQKYIKRSSWLVGGWSLAAWEVGRREGGGRRVYKICSPSAASHASVTVCTAVRSTGVSGLGLDTPLVLFQPVCQPSTLAKHTTWIVSITRFRLTGLYASCAYQRVV